MSVVNWGLLDYLRGSDTPNAGILGAQMEELRDGLTLYLTWKPMSAQFEGEYVKMVCMALGGSEVSVTKGTLK